MWTIPDSKVRHAYRLRVSLFLFAVILTTAVLVVGYQGIYTLRMLAASEHDRDQWQQTAEIIAPLNLRNGNAVADIGSGAGYFTLKLAPIVGERGGVFAVDILKEPLAFLWIRAHLRHQGNVHIIHGNQDYPHLPEVGVDAVLIANTYHEFMHPRSVLNQVFHALHPEAGSFSSIEVLCQPNKNPVHLNSGTTTYAPPRPKAIFAKRVLMCSADATVS